MMTVALLRSIKQSIVPTDKLLNGSKPIELMDSVCKSINCYAYALGIQHSLQVGEFTHFCPGFTFNNYLAWKGTMMESIALDLKALEIPHRIVKLNEPIILKPNEYLVKVFLQRNFLDFHFERYDPKRKIWFHKEGKRQPQVVHIYDDQVENSTFGCEANSYHFGDYRPEGYIAIGEPNPS